MNRSQRIAQSAAFCAILCAAAASGLAAQAETGATIGGSASEQAFATYVNDGPVDAEDFSYGAVTDLELALRAKGEHARAEATISARLFTGSAAAAAWSAAAAALARPDELMLPAYSQSVSSVPDAILGARVRTLYVKLDEGPFSLTAGRQIVNFGKGALWSPVDIFDELDLSGLSPDRRGSDALRLSDAIGETGSLDLVAAPAASPASGRYALRGTAFVSGAGFASGAGPFGGANLGLIAARDGSAAGSVGAWELGGDFKVDFGPSFYGDAIYELPDSGSGSLRAAVGADWSFDLADRKLVLAAQYYYEGTGASADPLFPGKHNIYASIAWAAGDFFSLSSNVIWRLDDGASQTTVILAWDAAQNASLDVYIQASASSGSAFVGLFGSMLEVKF
jgi:hypothetical protein